MRVWVQVLVAGHPIASGREAHSSLSLSVELGLARVRTEHAGPKSSQSMTTSDAGLIGVTGITTALTSVQG